MALHQHYSDSASDDASRGYDSESGGESKMEPVVDLAEDLPPTLMSLNRPARGCSSTQPRHSHARPHLSNGSASFDEGADNVVAATPPNLVFGQARNPQLRFSAARSISRNVGGGRNSMRNDQTAIPYVGIRSAGRALRGGRRGVPVSAEAGPTPSNVGENGRQPLQDMTNTRRNELPFRQRRRTGRWTDDQLARAMRAVEGGMRLASASELYEIPPSSLRDHLYGITLGRKRGGKVVLTPGEEQQIVNWITELQQLGHPITMATLRMKVAEICQGRETPFTEGIPGRGWLRWWRKRHPELSLRVAQGLEIARARGLSAGNVQSFYQNLEQLYERYQYSPEQVWNCDESGAQAGRNGGALVIATKGTRSVRQVIPDEREWLSVLVCVNEGGASIPSFYVFKGKRFRRNYIARCESGATMAMQPKAWMTSYLFSHWLSHFVKCLQEFGGVSSQRRHLLILDGHSSHVSLHAVEIARGQGIDLLSLPSHTSHTMQPLDVCLFKPFKNAFKAYRDYWTYRSGGAAAKKEHLAQWVSLALKRALTVQNIQKGFMVTGIWPLNREAMTGKMGPSRVYEEEREHPEPASTLQIEEIQADVEVPVEEEAQHFYVSVKDAGSGSDVDAPSEEPAPTMPEDLPPQEGPATISRFLTLPTVTIRRQRNQPEPLIDYSKSIILTSDEYLASMEQKSARREALEKSKEEKKKQREVEKMRKEEEKLKLQERKREREEERARKEVFDLSWSPAAVSAYGQDLHNRIRSGQPLPPNTYRSPFCGFPPEVCIENQRIAIERRRAKRRKEDASNLPPLTTPEWAHRPGAPLWSRIIPRQSRVVGAGGHGDTPSRSPRVMEWLRSPEEATQMFMRPFLGSELGDEAPTLPIRPEAHRATVDVQPGSPIAGVLSPDPRQHHSSGSGTQSSATEQSPRPPSSHDNSHALRFSDSLGFSTAHDL